MKVKTKKTKKQRSDQGNHTEVWSLRLFRASFRAIILRTKGLQTRTQLRSRACRFPRYWRVNLLVLLLKVKKDLDTLLSQLEYWLWRHCKKKKVRTQKQEEKSRLEQTDFTYILKSTRDLARLARPERANPLKLLGVTFYCRNMYQ